MPSPMTKHMGTVNMSDHSSDPRVLIIAPEIYCLPKAKDNHYQFINAKAGGLSDVSTALISALNNQGVDVHIALPDYRHIFNGHLRTAVEENLHYFGSCVPNDRIHLARDKAIFHHNRIYSCDGTDKIKFSIAFQREVSNKIRDGCAVGILNTPDPSYDPSIDEALVCTYSAANHLSRKKANKLALQKILNLNQDVQAPIFFWPSRLDPIQKGCQLLTEILYKVIHNYREQKLQIVFIADGEFQHHFKSIVEFHSLSDRVALSCFNEGLARLAYGASDFILMPSSFEPCGLVQMIGSIYGALPVAHDTGGLHDTVIHLDTDGNTGNGFLFKTFDSNGLYWAIGQAMQFYMLPVRIREQQISRIMMQSNSKFSYDVTAQRYVDLYEKMLKRPLIGQKAYAQDGKTKKHRKKTHPEQNHLDPIPTMPFADFFKHSNLEIYQKKGGSHGTAGHQL